MYEFNCLRTSNEAQDRADQIMGSELWFQSSLTETTDALAGAQKLQKTPPSDIPHKAANDVIAVSSFKQPETPFFPCAVYFFGSKDRAICFAVCLVSFGVLKRNTYARILSDESVTDESCNRYGVFSMACSHQATQLKVTHILTVDFHCNFFRHPAKSPK